MMRFRRRIPSMSSTFDTMMDSVMGELFPRNNRPKRPRMGGSRQRPRTKRQDFALELMEPRLLLSADLSFTTITNHDDTVVSDAPSSNVQIVDTAANVPAAPSQVVFLETSGALDVDYQGPVIVEGIDVPAFVAPGGLAGQEADVVGAMTTALSNTDFGVNLAFTNERPQSGDYSTVYIGGTGAEFATWGHFLGLAEDVDTGNQVHTDNAFVFSGNIAVNGLSATQYGEEIAGIVAHEIGHLIGTEPEHPVLAGNPLTAVAATTTDLIPGAVKEALIGTASDPDAVRGGGLQKLFELAQSIENLPALQTKIPGLDKSVAQLLSLSGTIEEKLQKPIIDFFKNDSTPTFGELFGIIAGATGTVQPSNDSFEVTFDLRKLLSSTPHFSLGDGTVGDGSGGFGLTINGDIKVDALAAFVDAATKTVPTFAFGVDATNATNPFFYVKAETLKLHASANAAPPATGINFQSSLGFLTVSVVDGSLAFDADITVDLSVLSGADDKITTDEFLSNLALLSPSPSGTLHDTTLPIFVQGVPGFGSDPDTPFELGKVVVSATDIFDLSTYNFDFDGTNPIDPSALDFGNLDAAGIITMIGQLGDQLDNLRENGLLDGLDIPLVGDAVDQVLNFADSVRRGLLYDPGADGQKDGVDRLVTDVNAALEKAGLGNMIIVQATGAGVGETTGDGTGTGLRFVVIDPTIEAFKITNAGSMTAFNSFGFDSDADDFSDVGGDNFIIHEATPTSTSGIINGTAVLQFTIKRAGVTPDESFNVTLDAGETSMNTGIGNDTIKLVRADNSATFDSVQGLIFRLATLAEELGIDLEETSAAAAGPTAMFAPAAASTTPKLVDYKSSEPGKPLIVNIGRFVPALNYVKDIPLDFNLDLGPVGTLTSDAKVTVTAHVGLDKAFGIGIYLGSFVPGADTLEPDTLLEDLNDGDGVRIKTAPALTADNAVPTDAVKAPSTDVTFTITINGVDHTIVVPAAADGGDINITKALRNQSETAIAVNPRDSNIIVVGANDFRIDSTDNKDRIWVTFNAGKDWQQLLVPVPSDTLGRSRGDPTLAFNEDGTKLVYMHLVRMLADSSGNDSTVVAAAVYSVLTDPVTGAKSLSAGTAVNIGRSSDVPLNRNGDTTITDAERLDLDGDFVADDDDKEYLAVGKDSNGNDLYVVAWNRDNAIYVSTSNNALTWSKPMIIGGVTGTKNNNVNFPGHGALDGGTANVPTATGSSIDSIPVIGPNGEIYVVWEDASTQGIGRVMFDELVFDPNKPATSELRLRGVNDTFVNFDTGMSKVLADSSTSDPGISAADKLKLDNFAALLAGDSHLRATISGYTDSDDFENATDVPDDIQKNQTLSNNRAISVFDYVKSKMVALGVSDAQIATQLLKVAYGETKSAAHWATVLTADNIVEQKNRRVTLTVDRVAYTGNVNYFNDPFNPLGDGFGLDGADHEYELPAQPSRGILMGLSIAVDNSSAHHGRIYVSFVDQGDRDGSADAGPSAAEIVDHNNTDVFVIASDNDGQTWDALLGAANAKTPFSGSTAFAGNQGVVLVKINDDTGSASQFFSWIDVDDTTGDVAVSWYDARNDDGTGALSKNKQLDSIANDEVEYFASYSRSGGLTWADNIQVSDGLSSAFLTSTDGANYGDYTGLSFHDGIIHMAWADNSNSTKDNPSAALVPAPDPGKVGPEAYYDLIRVGAPTTPVSKLVDDINRAISRAGIADKVHAVLDVDRLATGGFRISIEALDSSITLSVSADQNDPAVKVLGLPTSKDATGALVGAEVDTDRPEPDRYDLTSGDAKFSFQITKTGVATPIPVNVTVGVTTGNTSIGQLASKVGIAIDAALTAAPNLDPGDLTVTTSGNASLVIKINNDAITKVAYKANVANDTPIFEIGLPNEAVIVRSHVSATKDLVPVVGRLEHDATLTFSTSTDGTNFTDETVTLYADDTASNTTIVSLVDDLNKALSKAAIKTDVLSSFVLDSDISFDLTITQTLSDDTPPAITETRTETVTLLASDTNGSAPDTTANTTLDNLVSDLNKAIRAAFGWTTQTALVVAKSSGQTSALGEARIKLEGVSKTVNSVTTRVDKFRVQASAPNELGLPEDYTATNFAGRIKAESIGNKLVFSAIEAGADGFVGPQITKFQLSANAEAAEALGLTEKGSGDDADHLEADNTDFVITVTDSTGLPTGVFRITLDPTVVKDVQDLIDAIEDQTDDNVSVEINDEGGLTLIDNTFDKDSPGPATFMVAPVNGSAAATDLHIVGVDATTKSDRDGKIVGSSLFGGLRLLDRFFMENVQLQATANIVTPATGANFTANVGIVGVNLKANGSLDALFTIGLKDPAAEGTSGDDDRISLREFGRAFTDNIHNKGVRRLGFLSEATIVAGGGELDGVDITNLTNYQLAGDATFTLNIGRSLLHPGTDFVVKVDADDTDDNSTIGDLRDDVQAAIDAALAGSELEGLIEVDTSLSGAGLKLINNSGKDVFLSDRVALFDRPSLTGLGVLDFDVTVQLGGGLSRFITLPNNGHGSVHLATNLGDFFEHWADDVPGVADANPTAVSGETNKFTLDGDFTDKFIQGARVTIDAVGGDTKKSFRTFVDSVEKVEQADGTVKTTVTVIKGVQTVTDTNGKKVTTLADLPSDLTGIKIGTANITADTGAGFAALAATAETTPDKVVPDFDIAHDLGELLDFDKVQFNIGSLLDALLALRDLLNEFSTGQELLNAPIPLVDVSVNDLLDFAEKFADSLEAARANPASSLQFLDKTISEAFGVAVEPLVDLSGLTVTRVDSEPTHTLLDRIDISGDQTANILEGAIVSVRPDASSEPDFFAEVTSVTFTAGKTRLELDRELPTGLPATLTELVTISDLKKDLLRFSLDDLGDDDPDNDLLRLDFNLQAAFSRSLNVQIPEIDLPGELGGLVDFGGAATLSASGGASFGLDVGIAINDPTQVFLYSSSQLSGTLKLAGSDMAFKAGLGPLSLSIIGGQASIEGTVQASFDADGPGSPFTDGRVQLIFTGSSANLAAIVDAIEVTYSAPVYVDLPVFFPTESHGIGSVTLTGDLSSLLSAEDAKPQLLLDESAVKAEGTATGGDADTLTASGNDFGDVSEGDIIHIVSGTGAGQTRAIAVVDLDTDADPDDLTITVDRDWQTAADNTSKFAIYDKAITLDLSAVKQGLEDGFSNFSLLDQILIVVDGVDTVLAGVQDVMDGDVLGFSMPLVGDKLKGAADVVGDLRAGFIADFRSEVEKLAVPNQDGIKDILFKLLGPSGLDVLIATTDVVVKSGTADSATADTLTDTGFGAVDSLKGDLVRITAGAGAGQTRTIIANTATVLTVNEPWADALDNTSVYEVVNLAGEAVTTSSGKFVDGTLADITSFNNLANVSDVKDAEIWWKMKIGQNLVDAGADIGFDIGMPGLGLKTEGDINLNLTWELDLGFGLSGKDGFFFFINDDDELLLKFNVVADAALTGSLGFLQFTAENKDVDGNNTDGNTHLSATIAVDLYNKSDKIGPPHAPDERLGLSELGNLRFDVGVAADASVELGMTLGLTGDQGSFPEIQADFFLDWALPDGDPIAQGIQPISLFNPPADFSFGRSIQDGLKTVEFRNVGLDLGTYISNVVKPILEKIQDITEPVQPIIDIVTTPLPVLSDLGLDITLLDIAKMTGLVNPALITAIETIADVITLVNSIDVSEGSLVIPIGDFTIYEAADRDLIDSFVAGATNGKKFDLGSGSFDIKEVSGLFKPGGQIGQALGNISPVLGEIAGVAGEVLTNLAAANGVGPTAKPFKFDILEDPTSIFGLLMGEDVTLLSYDMAPLKLDGEFTAFFSIFGPLGVSINLEAALNVDFAFGYDTRGLRDFADSGFRNPLLLLDGLYVDDDPTPSDPSDGQDPAELIFDAGLWAAAELNLGIARGGVGGGLFFHAEFNLFDNDGDGKVRLDELATNFLNQLRVDNDLEKLLAPLAIFDVSGELTAELFAFLKIDFGFFTLDKRFNITDPVTLLDFDVNFNRPPVLASELDNGDLIINIGEFAGQRELGDLSDFGEHIKIEGAGPGKVKVSSDNIEDGDSPQTYNVTGKIIISAGEGDDIVELVGVDPAITFDIDGAAGDDKITGSGGGGIIHGGLGNDTLTGSDSADLIFGDEGDDVIDGRKGDDILLGDKGEVSDGFTLTSRQGFVRALVSSNDGADTIDGGDDDDVIAGSGGADILKGGANNDLIIGDGGLFTYNSPPVASETDKTQGAGDHIEGGDGNDWLYGGKGDDVIFGDNENAAGDGKDVIFGESGADTLHGDGGDENAGGEDTIFGDFGTFRLNAQGDLVPVVQVVGVDGADKIYGDGGNDQLLGGGGNDDMHGDAGKDTMWGGVGADVMRGGADDDIIFGETDQDKLFGDAGGDYLEGGAGNDYARGGEGGDLLIAGYGSDDLDGEEGEDTYRITARGGLVTERTIMYDTGENIGPNGEARPPDHVVLIGTSQADTVLLRAMADYYFPLVEKLVGDDTPGQEVAGLTDKIFASQEPDKLRAVLQALEDAYGPHAVANVVNVDGGPKTLDKLYEKIVKAYTDAVRTGVLAAVNAESAEIRTRVTAILDDKTTGLFPGKLEEIVQAIKLAYGVIPLPGDLINNVNKAWDTVPGTLKGDIETIIGNAYRTEAQVLGTNTDTGFVALLNNGGSDVERFNYRNIEDITVNTLDGNDYVVLDDALAATTVNLGLGEDKAQVGQVFRSERVRQFDNQPLVTGIKAEDVFTTLEITRGWLSNGVSQATTINGEDGNDQFTVFHNIAVLNLNGGEGDDFFTVRAFALKGSSDSERARTDMKGDGGADTILYVLNAPVGIDGGDGFDTVRIIGTEFSDDFVVTDDGVFGGGLNVSYVNIEKLIADGAEGNDRFFVMSTGNEVVTEIDGGLGSDTFFVGGNPSGAPVSVVSNDFRGHSGIILHSIEEGSDPAWLGTPIEGLSANIGDNEEEMALVVESLGFSRVREGALLGQEGYFDSYTISLTKAPTPTKTVQISILQALMSPTDEARGFRGLQFLDAALNPLLVGGKEFDEKTGIYFTPVLIFNTNPLSDDYWAKPHTVRFKAASDDGSEGQRFVFINHVLKDSTDLAYRDVKALSVKVQVDDDDRKSVIVTQSGRDNMVVEDGASNLGRTDTVDVVLSHVPDGDVKVKLTVLNNQVTLAHNGVTSVDGVLELTFTKDDWFTKQTVTIRAPDDTIVEGFHTDSIRYTVTSLLDKEDTLHSGTAVLASGTVSASAAIGATSLTDTGADFGDDDSLVGMTVRITSGAGAGQVRTISHNTATTLTVDHGWTVALSDLDDNASTYEVAADPKEDADGDFDLFGLQSEIPPTKPTDYVLLAHRPIVDTVRVFVDGNELQHGPRDIDPDTDGIQLDPDDHFNGPARFKVSGNTVTFLDDKGFAEKRVGIVQVIYDYKEAGYDNSFVKDTVVDIYDEDSPMVIIRPIETGPNNDGTIDVVEGGATDSYTVSLSRALTDDQKVMVKADAIETRTTYGRTAIFKEQVTVSGGVSTDFDSSTVLTFDKDNWKTGLTVTVTAINDTFRDGNETQVFAPDLQTVNKIRGPMIIEGAGGGGSLSLPAPLLLPHSPPVHFGDPSDDAQTAFSELNILPADGSVQAFEAGHGAGAVEFMTVLREDLRKVLVDLNRENSNIKTSSSNQDLEQLIGKTLEVSSGPGAGTVIDPSRPNDLYNRFWQILDLEDGATEGQVKLKLLNPSAVDPDKLFDPDNLFVNGVPTPSPDFARPTPGTTGTKYAITSLSANFFAREVDQVDYLFMFDNDSVGNDTGAFTSADGVVRQFTADSVDATKATMRVELGSLIAVARLLANRSDASLLNDLIGRNLEITVGPGEGRTWKITHISDALTDAPDLRELTLEEGTSPNPIVDPTINSEFRIAGGDSHGRIVGFGMGPNLQVAGRPQPGGISFGDIEVVEAHLGRGADEVRVDYATNAEDHPTRLRSSATDPTPADYYTQTIIDTGLGVDKVTIKLDKFEEDGITGEDGAFSLNLNAGDDIANATGSTLPLVIFGWDGADTITGGAGDDIIFGDRGRVDYIKTVLTDPDNNPNTPELVPVDHIITRLGHSAAPTIKNPMVIGATPTTLFDDRASFVKADLVGLSVQAIGTDGHVQFRTIVDVLDAHTLQIDRAWEQTPVFGQTDENGVVDTELNSAYHISVFPDDQTDGIFRSARLIQTIAPATGGNDSLYGGAGDDVLIGGTGNDMVDGGLNRDLIFGDIVTLDRTNTLGIYANPRFQALNGTQIYDTSTNTDAGGALVTGVSQVDPHASTFWGDLRISLNDSNFGNDYIAGGGGDDEIFGQLGNDVIQGDGSIDISFIGSPLPVLPAGLLANWQDGTSTVAAGASTVADRTVGSAGLDFRALVGAGRDTHNNLFVHPSVDDPGTDGDDYIEGGPGVDTVFGNLGQDDIIGGSSDLFSLTDKERRADGWDLLFGGSGGSDIARDTSADASDPSANSHSSDADTIVGDNGYIYRLVGVTFNGSQQIAPADGSSTLADGLIKTSNGFLAFNYDDPTYDSSQKIVVRAVQLIDYTPGGPDFAAVAAAGDIGAADEIHGGKGDDFIYGGKSNDVLFGDGQNDSIIGGYGADWISGGTGDDGILGDDGRIFASRNSTSFGEPLYGIARIQDNQITLLITEKTGKESAVINVAGALKYTADLTPDNLDPASVPDTQFRPFDANDIIYGGVGNDSIHSGAGDDAILGGEAPDIIILGGETIKIKAYVTNYDQITGDLVPVNNNTDNHSVTESDFAHPFNPGNPLGFKPNVIKGVDQGIFALYDTNGGDKGKSDALRKIMLTTSGTLSKTGNVPGANNLTWFLDFANEGPDDTFWVPTGGPQVPTDGDDRIFGDLGNDWVVGGTGRDMMFPGWGNDLVNADDNLETNGGLNNRTDTNPSYNDLVYGGAGLDVMIANTGADRMDDFVGEFNSFYVPYSNFGLPTVQRLPNPGLIDFLLQVANNDGADLSLAAQYSADPTRNGEPFGELGMVLQQDAAWQAQNGGPRDSQAGNLQNKADTTDNGLPIQQVVAAAAPYSTAVVTITQDELDSIVAAAKTLWATALGAGDPRLAVLDQVTVLAGNLPSGMLGETTGTQIVIDRSAQGWGWFVDPTPNDNSEFAIRLSSEALAASPSSPAAGRMDLLTTVVHEMGNAMGFAEDQGHDVMGMVLQAGERRVPIGDTRPLGDNAQPTTFTSGKLLPLPTVSEGAPAAVSPLATTATVLAGGILNGTDTFNVTTAGDGRSRHTFVDGGLPSGKKKSTDNLNMFYTPPRPTIIHSPATQDPVAGIVDLDYGTARFVVQYD